MSEYSEAEKLVAHVFFICRSALARYEEIWEEMIASDHDSDCLGLAAFMDGYEAAHADMLWEPDIDFKPSEDVIDFMWNMAPSEISEKWQEETRLKLLAGSMMLADLLVYRDAGDIEYYEEYYQTALELISKISN